MSQFKTTIADKGDSMIQQYYANISSSEKEKLRDRWMAIKLQAAFRSFSARKKWKKLIASVVLIQRWIRGYLARKAFVLKKQARFTQKNHKYFDYQARIIQRYFRGYYSRMYIHDYFARDNYLEFIKDKNSQTRQELARYNTAQQEFVRKKNEEQARSEFKNIVKNLHHLKSTSHIAGIYNSQYQPAKPSAFGIDIETHLQSTFHAQYKWKAPKKDDISYFKRTLPPIKRKYNYQANTEVQAKKKLTKYYAT